MNIRLDGKRTLVTGANSGIGAAVALSLAEAGAKVAINYVTGRTIFVDGGMTDYPSFAHGG